MLFFSTEARFRFGLALIPMTEDLHEEALEESLSALAFSSSVDGEYSRFTTALTLFP